MPRGLQSPERLAEIAAVVMCWQARQRAANGLHARPEGVYSPAELQAATGLSPRTLAAPLVLLGWHRVTVWAREGDTRVWRGEAWPGGRRRGTRRVLRTFWVAPGGEAPRPARGRPRHNFEWLFA